MTELVNSSMDLFIKTNLDADIISLALKYRGKTEFDLNFALEQIRLYKKAAKKLPEFVDKFCFFPGKAYEQSSSESVAFFKSTLFSGDTLIDLSGGLGVDDWAFAKVFKKVLSIDKDQNLNKIVRENFKKLGLNNVERIDAEAEVFLQNIYKADLVYIDPDRRNDSGKRTFLLKDSQPEILKIKSRLFEIAPKILLKFSPMSDIHYLIKELPETSMIWVISQNNEVKELLCLLEKGNEKFQKIIAIDLQEKGNKKFESSQEKEDVETVKESPEYFYEPGTALIKAGLVKAFAASEKMQHINKEGIYLSADRVINNFFGRSFRVLFKGDYKSKEIRAYLKKQKIGYLNIAARLFPKSPEELKKELKIKDGGEDYFFFTKDAENKLCFFHCRKLQL